MTAGRPAPVRVAVLGAGVVGSQVIKLLTQDAQDLAAKAGAPLELVGVAVADVAAQSPQELGVAADLLTDDAVGLATKADIVVELMGGMEPARSAILAALESGAAVVTANKALLAAKGPELYAAAERAGVDLYFEAAVGGAIPILRPIQESLAGDTITRILGIVNGTTNYILDRMTADAVPFEQVLAQAQELGYAEADPTADIEGYDAASKAAILASLAFHTQVPLEAVYREGISSIRPADVEAASATGHVIKMLAIVERAPLAGAASADGEAAAGSQPTGVIARVHPVLIEQSHPLASVHGAFNAIFVEAEAAGELMFYGHGAGGRPTASAVVGDVVNAARHRVFGGAGHVESTYLDLPILPADNATTQYQIRLIVVDQPGVLAQVARVFASKGVSIDAVRQTPLRPNTGPAWHANLTIVTHAAREGALRQVVEALALESVVVAVDGVIRVEGEGE
jgi:homoserine dehydrogenase